MAGCPGKEVAELIRLSYQEAYITVVPLVCGQVLEEHEEGVKVCLFQQVRLPSDEEGCADVEVEVGESVGLSQAGLVTN